MRNPQLNAADLARRPLPDTPGHHEPLGLFGVGKNHGELVPPVAAGDIQVLSNTSPDNGPELREQLDAAFVTVSSSVQRQLQPDVLHGGEEGEEVVGLEDEAELRMSEIDARAL